MITTLLLTISYLFNTLDRMEPAKKSDSDSDSDSDDECAEIYRNFCFWCASGSPTCPTPFCCSNHREIFVLGYGLKWCGGVEQPYQCNVCESEPYYRSQYFEVMYEWYANKNSDKGIRPIDSAICMFEELSLMELLFNILLDLYEYF